MQTQKINKEGEKHSYGVEIFKHLYRNNYFSIVFFRLRFRSNDFNRSNRNEKFDRNDFNRNVIEIEM